MKTVFVVGAGPAGMFAATVAFGVWSWAVPGNPFLHTAGRLMAAWFVAVLVSALLGVIDKIINPSDPAA